MSESTSRLIARIIGAALIAVAVGAIVRVTVQIRSIDRHPCGPERAVVYNDTEREIRVQGIALQEDGSVQDADIVLPPNQSSEEAGLCSAYEMTVSGAKDWFYKGREMRPGVWVVISTGNTYCISGEEPGTQAWYEVMCRKEPVNTDWGGWGLTRAGPKASSWSYGRPLMILTFGSRCRWIRSKVNLR